MCANQASRAPGLKNFALRRSQERDLGLSGATNRGGTGDSVSLLRNNCHVQGQESPGAGPARCFFGYPSDVSLPPGSGVALDVPSDESTIVGSVASGSARPVVSTGQSDLFPALCLWCKWPIPRGKRRDSIFCSKLCRQASWRFHVHPCELQATDPPMHFAYADPPYPGKADYYPEKQEVDHPSLLDRLVKEYADGWALSTSARSLRDILLLCPPHVRVCAWLRRARNGRSRRALTSWEPLIVCGGRPLPTDRACGLKDALIARGRYRAFPGAMVGMKPPAFAEWMFRQLGASRGDLLDDLFPGSGAIRLAWTRYTGAE